MPTYTTSWPPFSPSKARISKPARHTAKALETDPRHALAAFNLGALLVANGKNAEAKAYFQQAVDSDPNLAEAHLNLGNQYAVEGEYARAESHFQRAAASPDPNLRQAARDSLTRLRSARGIQ